jgi:hypothetical protein
MLPAGCVSLPCSPHGARVCVYINEKENKTAADVLRAAAAFVHQQK